MDENNMQLCRICISNSECATMIPIFGEDLLWKKIIMVADVKMEKGDTLPQQVCIECAKSAISACMFKKKCEDADNFFRNHLQMMRKMEHHQRTERSTEGGGDAISISEGSDNDPGGGGSGNCMSDDIQLGGRNLLPAAAGVNNPHNMMLMNGNNNSSNSGGGGGGALNHMDYKNYDMNSVRLMMNNYLMDQQAKEADAMAAVNGYQGGFNAPPCETSMDDDQLPLIPEIELITPHDEGMMDRQQNNGNGQGHGYQCSVCYQLFARKLILKDHMQSCHGRSPPVYECTNCKKSYLYKRFLEKHIRRGRCVKKRRNQTRPMECTDCHVLFPTGHHLGWHKRTGCPSRAAKVPLQQLFKQNIVQYNNFPKPVIAPRKPDNAFYMQTRRILPNISKRKGRTRIKLDATKIALAKHLILKEATTTQIAQELDISRTFAWRLRKNLVNGVSLHERCPDTPAEEFIQKPEIQQQQVEAAIPEASKAATEQIEMSIKTEQIEETGHQNAENSVEIKQELQDEEDEDEEDDSDDKDDDEDDDDDSDSDDTDDDSDDDSDDDEDEKDTNKNAVEQLSGAHNNEQLIKHEQNFQNAYANGGLNHLQKQIDQANYGGIPPQAASVMGLPNINQTDLKSENAESDSESNSDEDAEDNDDEEDDDDEEEDSEEEEGTGAGQDQGEINEEQMQRYKQHFMQTIPSVFQIPQPGFPQPVNLSIKSVQPQSTNLTPTTKKPRKPNVFIDDEKYATAKILVSQNSSTMEIARQLNVSQMTAWKLRDAIVKGVPLSYRSKRETRPKPEKPPKPAASSTPKEKLPRRRLKAADRELRDREITREILEMIKEDSNIQYWKISARLAEKGFAISPSSVCQKLKALGIHRRWKPGDKPPILDMDNMKTNSSGGDGGGGGGGGGDGGVGGGAGFGGGTSTDSFEFNNEQQFELGGAHFLSAFTH